MAESKFCDACGLRYAPQQIVEVPLTILDIKTQLCETCRKDIFEYFKALVTRER